MLLPHPPIVLQPTRVPQWRARVPWTEERMGRIAGAVERLQQERTLAGLDAQDRPVKPLAEKYKRRKQRLGKRPVRDMRLTGNMMGALATTELSDREFAVGFRGATPKKKAHFRQLFDGFFGISPGDAVGLDEELTAVHEEVVAELAVQGG